ncbi:methyltransferase, partial [Rhizobium leguminosarum]|nr:methyltransferase [Rhizobium leguminosarum]
MDSRIQDVLDIYHAMIETEHDSPRELPPGGRDGGQDQRLRAVGPATGQFINILA